MIRKLIALFLLSCVAVFAAETPASADSVKELLRVTNVRSLLDKTWPQMEAMMGNVMQQSLRGQTLSAQQQQNVHQLETKLVASLKDEMSWDKLEPMYVDIYQKSFSQDEVDGMLAFYKSPAGEAVIKKMPVVVQQTMLAMQQRVIPMMQRIQKDIQESVQQLKQQNEAKPEAKP